MYLDAKGLVAAWREGLLALAVLSGKTKGYRHHPQLERFRGAADPVNALVAYLGPLADEADARGYRFDRARLAANGPDFLTATDGARIGDGGPIPVSSGQIAYEAALLLCKLERRDPERVPALARDMPDNLEVNPAFRAIPLGALPAETGPGGIAPWERPIPEALARMKRGN